MVGKIMREIRYVKPNMNNLKGKRGRHVLESIRNMPPSSHEQLKREADECMERILAARKNGN